MRNVGFLFVTVLVGTILAVSQTAGGAAVSAFNQELISQQKQLLDATQNKNSTAVDHAVAEDFAGIAINGDTYDKSEVVESAQSGTPKGFRSYDFQVVKLNDDSAVVAYNLVVPGEHPRYRHMADTWAKVGGQWKLKFRQVTGNLWSANDLD
jgi:hypothetical protein